MSDPGDLDDDEKTVMAWLTPQPGDEVPPAFRKPPPRKKDKEEIAPLPRPDETAPPVPHQPVSESSFPPLPGSGQSFVDGTIAPGDLPPLQPPMAKQDDPEAEDDDKTMIGAPLDWFDAPESAPDGTPEDTPEDTASRPTEQEVENLDWFDAPEEAEDDDKTVMAPLPLPPVATAPRPEVPFPDYVPKEAWSKADRVEQALRGHGLQTAMRRAGRRAPEGLSPANRNDLIRAAGQRLTHPEDAFLDDQVLETFRQLVAAEKHELELEELDHDTRIMPSNLSERQQQEWMALGRGLFAVLRELERRAGDKPRIGRNRRLHEQLVRMGQDPYMGVPHSDIARYDPGKKAPLVRAQFMGFFGPFGAFPLNWSEEVRRWFDNGDPSFVAFVDIFTERFQELFFRAWSDSSAITQFDHPTDDRFLSYLLSFTGNGSAAMKSRDAVPDEVKARYAGLASGRVKSPVRLRQILQLHFKGKLTVDIEELVPTWLDFEPDTLSHVGMQASTMGMDVHLGSRVRSVGEKIRIHLQVRTIEDYFRLLPSGADHAHLRDLVFWYLGEAFEIEAVLWLPQPEIRPAVLGVNAQVGWMACIAPDPGDPDHMVRATEFKLLPLKTGTAQEAA